MGAGQSGKVTGLARRRVAQDLYHSREAAPILPHSTMEMSALETHGEWKHAMISPAQVIVSTITKTILVLCVTSYHPVKILSYGLPLIIV